MVKLHHHTVLFQPKWFYDLDPLDQSHTWILALKEDIVLQHVGRCYSLKDQQGPCHGSNTHIKHYQQTVKTRLTLKEKFFCLSYMSSVATTDCICPWKIPAKLLAAHLHLTWRRCPFYHCTMRNMKNLDGGILRRRHFCARAKWSQHWKHRSSYVQRTGGKNALRKARCSPGSPFLLSAVM